MSVVKCDLGEENHTVSVIVESVVHPISATY